MKKTGKKKCLGCGLELSLECYQWQRKSAGKLQARCKSCRHVIWKRKYFEEGWQGRQAKHYQENREEILKIQKLYTEANRERINERRRARYRHDGGKEKMHKWYQEHKEEQKERNKRYLATHREEFNCYERARRQRGFYVEEKFTVEMANFTRKFWEYSCAVCDIRETPSENRFPIDHWLPLTPANGGVGYPLAIGNAVLLCPTDNQIKYNLLAREVFEEDVARRIDLRLQDQIILWNSQLKEAEHEA